jgi:hypothetical protein
MGDDRQFAPDGSRGHERHSAITIACQMSVIEFGEIELSDGVALQAVQSDRLSFSTALLGGYGIAVPLEQVSESYGSGAL